MDSEQLLDKELGEEMQRERDEDICERYEETFRVLEDGVGQDWNILSNRL